MGFLSRLYDRIDARLDRRPDMSVLDARQNPGSESMIEAGSEDGAVAAARG